LSLVLAKQPVSVADQAARLALPISQVLKGDIVIQDDIDHAYILIADDPSVANNWHEIDAGSDIGQQLATLGASLTTETNRAQAAEAQARRVLSSSDPRWAFPTDGTTACDSQLVLLLAAATALGGADIYLDPIAATTYKLTNSFTLPNNCTLSASTAVSLSSSNSSVITLGSFSEIRDLNLVSTYSAGTGVLVNIGNGAHNSTVKNCWLDSPKAHCVQANTTGIHDIAFIGNRFINSSYGMLLNSGSPDIYNIKILDNTFEAGISADAIELNWPSSAWNGSGGGRNVLIRGNHITTSPTSGSSPGSGFGIGIAGGRQINIVGNTFEGTRNQAIHIEDNSSYINIAGNTINDVGHGLILTGCSGITVASASKFVTITGNTINNCAENGIYSVYTSTTYAKSIVISNNVITNNTTGIQFSADFVTGALGAISVQNVICANNIVANNTSHGIGTGGSGSGAVIEGNICEANGGYGINIGTAHKYATIVRGNICENNTLGETNLNYTSGALAASNDYFKSAVYPLVSGAVGPISLFLCGRSTVGTLIVFAQSGAHRCTVAYQINWDGNKLRATLIASDVTSSVQIPQPTMLGNMLQVSATNSNGADTTLSMSFEFYGTTINDNVVGSGTPLVVDEPTIVRGTAPPTTGTWRSADTVWNTATSGVPGWRCSVGGTPGTWIAMADPAAVATITGQYLGSAATFVGLPTTDAASQAASNGDWAFLTADVVGTGTTTAPQYPRGAYVYNGTAFTLGISIGADFIVGTTAGTVAAGNDSRIVGAVQAANNGSDFANAQTVRVNVGAAHRLIPTTLKTSTYTAALGDLVLADATNGTVPLTAPSSAVAGSRFGVAKLDTSTNTVTLTAAGSDVFITGSSGGTVTTSTTVTLAYAETREWVYDGAGKWKVANGQTPIATLTSLFLKTRRSISATGSTAAWSDAIEADTTSGAFPIVLPSAASATSTSELTITNIGANTLTLTGTVSGVTNPTLSQWSSRTIRSTGSALYFV
jgi:hypothetical protein